MGEFLWNYVKKIEEIYNCNSLGCVELEHATINNSNWWQAAPFLNMGVKILLHWGNLFIYVGEFSWKLDSYSRRNTTVTVWGVLGFANATALHWNVWFSAPLNIQSLKNWWHWDNILIYAWINFCGMMMINWGDIGDHLQGINGH